MTKLEYALVRNVVLKEERHVVKDESLATVK